MSLNLSQIQLINAITKYIDKQGFTQVNSRQFNAIIEATNLIVREFHTPHAPAVDGSGLAAWLASDETGISSRAMARKLAPLAGISIGVYVPHSRFGDHPADPADLGRCVGLLDAVPELRPFLGEMAAESPEWGALVGAWDELEGLYREERPKGKAPRCLKRMRGLIEAAERERATPLGGQILGLGE